MAGVACCPAWVDNNDGALINGMSIFNSNSTGCFRVTDSRLGRVSNSMAGKAIVEHALSEDPFTALMYGNDTKLFTF